MTTDPHAADSPAILLIAGHWLGSWAWDQVLEPLRSSGARASALTLPGLDPDDPQRASRTLEDQADAIRAAVGSERGGVVLVVHSGANAPASLVIDQIPERISRVIWVDSGPVASGTAFDQDLGDDVLEVPLPPFDVLGEQASLEGLDVETLDRFRARAVPEPAAVIRGVVALGDPARRAVPNTLVCCSISGEQVFELARSGHPMFAEVSRLEDVDAVDLPTGHWPMWSRPEDLAETILQAARRAR